MKGSLVIENVTKSYGSFTALDTVSLEIPIGQLTSFLGPSGCGKTTLLRLIAGFDTPSSGRIWLDGRDITTLKPQKRGLGVVFQSLALFPHMSVAENIAYGLKRRKVGAADSAARVSDLLAMTRLAGLGDRSIAALSGGQRQRVAIARALAVDPQLLLLDEPMSALDARLRDQMQIELRDLQQRLAITTLFVTHDQSEAMMLSDRIAVFSAGRLQQYGKPSEVYRNPANAFVADFLGASNLIAGRVVGDGRVSAMGTTLSIPSRCRTGTKVTLGLRAEDLGFTATPGDIAITGEVQLNRDLGSHREVIVRCAGEMLRVKSQRRDGHLSPGMPVTLHVQPGAISLFAE